MTPDILLQNLVDNRPTEIGGSVGSNRTDYQKYWTIEKLLDLHASGNPYIVICDYHDDVVAIYGDGNIDRLHFYQVKTKAQSTWSLPDLTRCARHSRHSILGRIYNHFLVFGDDIMLSLVSCSPFKISLVNPPKSEERTSFFVSDCDTTVCNHINSKLSAEHNRPASLPSDVDISFILSNIPIADPKTYCVGLIAQFLATLDPSSIIQPSITLESLYNYISGCVSCEMNAFNSANDLRSFKGVSRDLMDDFLRRAMHYSKRNPSSLRSQLEQNLQNIGFGEKSSIVNGFYNYIMQNMIKPLLTDADIQRIRILVTNDVSSFPSISFYALAKGIVKKCQISNIDDATLLYAVIWELLQYEP